LEATAVGSWKLPKARLPQMGWQTNNVLQADDPGQVAGRRLANGGGPIEASTKTLAD
jgi:hypothetical protein